jgi:hypothetical protein
VVPGSCARVVTHCAEVRGSGKGFQESGVGRERKGRSGEKRGRYDFKSRFAKQGPDEQLEVLYNSKPLKKDQR